MSYYLRPSRARHYYVCHLCGDSIEPKAPYYRDEPDPTLRRVYGATVRQLCVPCVENYEAMAWYRRHTPGKELYSRHESQIIIEPEVRLLDVTQATLQSLQADWNEVYRMNPEDFEKLIGNRLEAFGCDVKRTGQSNRKDGGIDIIFSTPGVLPLLGAVQVKHHRSPDIHSGPGDVRDFSGAVVAPFHLGVIVTNTKFTPDARWFAANKSHLLRLRDGEDLKEWIRDKFMEGERWKPVPKTIELCPGISIEVPIFG